MDQPTKDAFAKLTTTVERQSDALAALSETVGTLSKTVERGFAAVAEDIAEFRAEFRAFKDFTTEELRAIRSEVADIRRELDALKQRVDHMSGYTKEIDHLFERVRAIEQHLGIETKIAA